MKITNLVLVFCLLFAGFWACKPYKEKENPENGIPVDCTFALPDLGKINQFILQYPNDAKLFRIRSLVLLDSGRYTEALSDAKRALSLAPADLYNFVVVAKAHRAMGHIDSALSACHTAEKEGFDDPDNNLLLGDLYLIIRRYDKSLEYLNKALKQAPFEPKIYYKKGVLFWEKGDTTKALSSWQTAIEQDPTFGDGFARLAAYYMSANQFQTAEQYLRSGLRLKPNDAFLHYNMGVFLNFKGFKDSAITAYRQALALDGKLYPAQENLGFLLANKGELEEAVGLLESALPSDPKNPTLHYVLAKAYLSLKQLDKASEHFNTVLRLDKEWVKDAKSALDRIPKLKMNLAKDSVKKAS